MGTIARAVSIRAPRAAVWAALADIGGVSRMSAAVTNSRLTSDLETGLGATRHCDLAMMGATVEERVTAWEDGKRMEIDIYQRTRMPMVRSMTAELLVVDEGEGARLTGTMRYELGMGPIGGLMDALMMRGMMTRNWAAFLAGVRHHVETGEVLDGSSEVDLSCVEVA